MTPQSSPEVVERATPARGRLSPGAAAALTFIAAACVLVLEIAAARLLAPYVGVTLTTYTGIIGVILAGIALGAWVGGRLADAVGPETMLGGAFLLGGCAAIAAVPIVALVGSQRLPSGPSEVVILATLGFVAPATIISSVAPMIVRATLVDVATSGSIVGRLSAIGTAGAITGTFLTGFFLLGFLPTRLLIVVTGGILVAIGLLLIWGFGRSAAGVVVGLVLALAVVGASLAVEPLCERESANYCIDVVEDLGNPGGRTLVLDGLSHAYVDLDAPDRLAFAYIRRFADVAAGPIAARNGSFDALHVGGGGFSFPRFLAASHPGARQTVLELDPAIVETARAELGLATSDRLRVIVGDARLSIVDVPTDSVDLVFGDAFGGLAVPWHLTTREMLEEIDRVLRPGGTYVMNVIDYPPLGFVRAETATAGIVFEDVAIVASPDELAGRSGGNFVVVASDRPIDVAGIEARIADRGEGAALVSGQAEVRAWVGGARVLTDDFAPVDQLLGR